MIAGLIYVNLRNLWIHSKEARRHGGRSRDAAVRRPTPVYPTVENVGSLFGAAVNCVLTLEKELAEVAARRAPWLQAP